MVNNDLQSAIREWTLVEKDIDWKNCLSLTLTMKQFVYGETLDEINAGRNFRHFINRLQRQVFGNRTKRFGVRLNILPVLETSKSERLHIHALVEIPDQFKGHPPGKAWFKHLITRNWEATRFGYNENKIIDLCPENPKGWGNYITKFHHYQDSPLWECYHWAR